MPAPVPQKVERASLCRFRTEETCDALAHEIERATVVDPRQVAEDVVTMNAKALPQVDGDEEVEVALVYPEDADDRAGKLSVCPGIGCGRPPPVGSCDQRSTSTGTPLVRSSAVVVLPTISCRMREWP